MPPRPESAFSTARATMGALALTEARPRLRFRRLAQRHRGRRHLVLLWGSAHLWHRDLVERNQIKSPTGQGGFGVSTFFARPTYQDGISPELMRSVPDVALSADPAGGISICQAGQWWMSQWSSFLAAPASPLRRGLLMRLCSINSAGKRLGLLNDHGVPRQDRRQFESGDDVSSHLFPPGEVAHIRRRRSLCCADGWSWRTAT